MRVICVLILAAAPFFAQGNANDDRIWDQVRLKLSADRDVGRSDFTVIVKDGVVTLRGKLRTAKLKEKAEKIAKKVKGVTSVVNEIQVTGG